MTDAAEKPELRVTVFSDVICPFCYIGAARLDRLRDEYDLRVNWCFLEIHPETPAAGMPVSQLDYDPQRWQTMMMALSKLAEDDGLVFAEHDFTTNSRQALLLAEAAKEQGREVFYALHNALFAAFFTNKKNIGDTQLLKRLAANAGMSEENVQSAWSEPRFTERLKQFQVVAQELGVKATPTIFIGEQRLDGAVPLKQLREAARIALSA